jgi:hypothetical protein
MKRLEPRVERLERQRSGYRPLIVIVGLSDVAGELMGYHCGNTYVARQAGEDERTLQARAMAVADNGGVLVLLDEHRVANSARG